MGQRKNKSALHDRLAVFFSRLALQLAAFYSAAKPKFLFRRRPAANSAAEGSNNNDVDQLVRVRGRCS